MNNFPKIIISGGGTGGHIFPAVAIANALKSISPNCEILFVGAEGKNWLFFGEQHFVLDFYYQTEIQEWLTTGVLTKLDTAFSRDQERKIYVQDRIREKAKAFNNWLENGASIYICGQKNPMSQDVEQAIVEVISKERNITVSEAKQILEELENQGKYQKDVY